MLRTDIGIENKEAQLMDVLADIEPRGRVIKRPESAARECEEEC